MKAHCWNGFIRKQRCLMFGTLALILPALLIGSIAGVRAQNQAGKPAHLWKPIPDDPYLQEVGDMVPTVKPVITVGVYHKSVYVAVGDTLCTLKDGKLAEIVNSPKNVYRMKTLGDALWAFGDSGVYRFTGRDWKLIDRQSFADLCMHLGQVYGATSKDLFRFDGEKIHTRTAHRA